jgi:UDP-N-acetylmuramoyl-tripeptide--D-alanyl-D-alanine ligase
MAGVFQVHSPSFQSIVLATRGEVVRRPLIDPTSLTTDSRGIPAGACFVALRGETFDGHAFVAGAAEAGAALAIVERALSTDELVALPDGFGVLRVASTRAALGQIAHAWRTSIRRLRVVAVTGSAGKTTTRRLVEGILSEAGPTHASPKSFNNDIGVPLTLLSTPDEARFLVAEIGMNHPGEILPLTEMAEPEAGIITLAGRAHLEGLGSVEAVAKEKASLLAGVASTGFGVVNGDNPPLLHAVARLVDEGRAPERILLYGLGASCDYRLVGRRAFADGDAEKLAHGFEQEIEVLLPRHALAARGLVGEDAPSADDGRRRFRLKMAGEHNARNALAAIATAYEMGLDEAAIARGVAAVGASDMRLERVALAGRTIYNDAYNANPDAMIASLRAFAELAAAAPRRVAILGEMRELGDGARALHEEVGTHAGRALGAGDALLAVGPHAEALVAAARSAGFAGDSAHASAFTDAFALEAAALIPTGSAVLLKGSRGARMERFLAPLEAGFAGAAAGA